MPAIPAAIGQPDASASSRPILLVVPQVAHARLHAGSLTRCQPGLAGLRGEELGHLPCPAGRHGQRLDGYPVFGGRITGRVDGHAPRHHHRIAEQRHRDPIIQADAYRQARVVRQGRPRRSVSPVLTTKRVVTAAAAACTAATALMLALPGPARAAAHQVAAPNGASHLSGSHTAIKRGASQVKW
jgi:hypothetical protein